MWNGKSVNMRIETDQESNQNECKNINQKYKIKISISHTNGCKGFTAE